MLERREMSLELDFSVDTHVDSFQILPIVELTGIGGLHASC